MLRRTRVQCSFKDFCSSSTLPPDCIKPCPPKIEEVQGEILELKQSFESNSRVHPNYSLKQKRGCLETEVQRCFGSAPPLFLSKKLETTVSAPKVASAPKVEQLRCRMGANRHQHDLEALGAHRHT